MTDTTFTEEAPPLAQPTPEKMTKRELAVRGIDAVDGDKARAVTISSSAGGITFASMIEVMDFSKLMAVAGAAIPPAFRNNPGMCLAVTMQAVEWRMSPFQVANKAYIVNDRIGWESQLVHAVIEARAPIKGRLRCSYDGEGPTRTCTVWATFVGEDEPHEYTTPQAGSIKVKNSPLWTGDLDQQLFYFGSRSWGRKWCPDVLLGIYTREELADDPALGRADDTAPGLAQRLVRREGAEGHSDGHAERELANLAPDRPGVVVDAGAPPPEGGGDSSPGKGGGGSGAASPAGATAPAATKAAGKGGGVPTASRKAKAHRVPSNPPSDKAVKAAVDRAEKSSAAAKAKEPAKPAPAPAAPEIPETAAKCKTPEEYVAYARRWIDLSTKMPAAMDRFDEESSVRRRLKVPIKSGAELQGRIEHRFES